MVDRIHLRRSTDKQTDARQHHLDTLPAERKAHRVHAARITAAEIPGP
ncbi:hypothetical protein [Nonomuraea diastatica]|nr:hypothetical protein [Nonomuraea diastatica]